jgi:hypothetical protein
MDFKDIHSCEKCGLVFNIDKLVFGTDLGESESLYSEDTKRQYSKIGVCFKQVYSHTTYFFCPVCETLNEVEQ